MKMKKRFFQFLFSDEIDSNFNYNNFMLFFSANLIDFLSAFTVLEETTNVKWSHLNLTGSCRHTYLTTFHTFLVVGEAYAVCNQTKYCMYVCMYSSLSKDIAIMELHQTCNFTMQKNLKTRYLHN